MPVYSSNCTFAGTTPLQSATNGWDAVYAVTFDTINQDIAARQPWLIDFVGSGPGKFEQSDTSGNQIVDATVGGLAVAPGGSGNLVQFALSISGGDLTIAGTAAVPLSDIVATIQCQLDFVANPTTPGLHDLTVDLASGLTVISVTGNAGSPASPLVAFQTTVLEGLIGAFVNSQPALFTGVYANVFTKDYAESVNIPWLLPSAFNYAVADLPSPMSGGILAVLASASGNVSGLVAEVDPLFFPTNPGVNAAAALSPEIVADDTFVAQFNSQIGSTLAPFAFNAASGLLMNTAAVSAYYRIDALTGQVSIIPASALATGSGQTFPFTIPIGGLSFVFSNNAITANIANGVVDLGNGYTQTIQLSTSYQLIVDQDGSQNIDLVLTGSPIITSSITAPPSTSIGQIAIDVGINAGSIILGEGLSFIVDKVIAGVSSTAMSNATIASLTRNFFAAERQISADPTVGVNFGIKGGRNVSMATSGRLAAADAMPLDQRYVDAVTLQPDYGFNTADPAADVLTVPFAQRLLELIGNGNHPTPMGELKTSVFEAGYPAAANWSTFPARVAIPANLTGGELSAIYRGCVAFVDNATNSGRLTYSVYGSLVAEFPAATKAPAVAARTAPLSAFAGGRDDGAICIRTSAGQTGIDTNATGGLFQDLRAASESGRYGLAAPIFRDIILNTERPFLVKLAGYALYLGGLVGGYFLGQALSNLQSGATEASEDAAKLAAGGPNGPSSLLFSNVSFPFMTRFSSGGSTGPAPANVLQCAAVNGGLILGVNIAIDQN